MTEKNIQDPLKIKCLVLGSSGGGKTSFNRRYFHGTYESYRKSTICADFYTKIIANPYFDPPLEENSEKKKKSKKKKKKTKKKKSKDSSSRNSSSSNDITQISKISFQVWDTAGKERLLSKSDKLTSRLGDSFFRHANVAILIYDATSSRSFLQLIKWHKELLERMTSVQDLTISKYNDMSRIQETFPILVVATKLDLLNAEQAKKVTRVEQRSIMGLNNGFRGMDYHYEYGIVNGTEVQQVTCNQPNGNNSKKKSPHRKDTAHNPSLFGLEHGSWASDASYENYVRLAEDELYPDRELVKRWCKRQGIKHVEVSALENIGVDDAIECAVKLAVEAMIDQQNSEIEIATKSTFDSLYEDDNIPQETIPPEKRQADNSQLCSFFLTRMLNFLGLNKKF